jgi:hypothetical protein
MSLIDSSENGTYSSPKFKAECAVWEDWECQECGALFSIEDGEIYERNNPFNNVHDSFI